MTERKYRLEWDDLKPPPAWLPDELGELEVMCWCEEEIVHVKQDVVKAGRTRTCGRPNCRP